jgi:predicted AAA+ superfamily ATPase
LSVLEVSRANHSSFNLENLWLRGGFPDGYLAATDNDSWAWRSDFISSYVEKDNPLMGPQNATITMRRLWSMLSHNNAQKINFSKLGANLGVSYKTIKNYVDTLTDFYMLRQIQPWS